MFFVKTTLAPGVCVRVEVRSDNVFTRCHCCGDEMQVNLTEVFADGKGTLEDTDVLCKDCTDMLMERMRDSGASVNSTRRATTTRPPMKRSRT